MSSSQISSLSSPWSVLRSHSIPVLNFFKLVESDYCNSSGPATSPGPRGALDSPLPSEPKPTPETLVIDIYFGTY